MKLPLSWSSAELGTLAYSIVGGGTPDKSNSANFSGPIPFMTVKDMKGRFVSSTVDSISELAVASSATTLIPADTLVIATRMSLGKIVRPQMQVAINQDLKGLFLKEGLDKTYIEYFWRSQSQHIESLGTGTTVKGIRLEHIRDLLVPLAPAAEQRRIADKLDTVLARVDAVNDRLARVAPLLKRFRQSVLAAATSGKLTEEWRRAAGAEVEFQAVGMPASWRLAKFKEICIEITVGFVGKMADQYVESGVPFLRSMNVRPFRFDRTGLQYISPAFHQQLAKSRLRPGDMAIVRSGAPGVCCVVPDDLAEANCSDLVIARPGPELLAGYGCIFMNSSFGAAHVASNVVGVAQAHFNVGSMKETPLPLPPREEQREIVRRVDLLFAYADRLEARLQAAQTAVERLTPALLAKAFRGELVPQDPNDEPASELLRRLRESPAGAISKPKRGRRPVSA